MPAPYYPNYARPNTNPAINTAGNPMVAAAQQAPNTTNINNNIVMPAIPLRPEPNNMTAYNGYGPNPNQFAPNPAYPPVYPNVNMAARPLFNWPTFATGTGSLFDSGLFSNNRNTSYVASNTPVTQPYVLGNSNAYSNAYNGAYSNAYSGGDQSGFGFRPNAAPSQSGATPIATASPRELTVKRSAVIARTVRRCVALTRAARACASELPATVRAITTAATAAARHQQLRRAILLAWFAFAKCALPLERQAGSIAALEALLKAALGEFARAPFESFFVAPFVRDMQSKPAHTHQRVIMRLHHVGVACLAQALRIGQSLSVCDAAANVLHLLGAAVAGLSESDAAAVAIRCMTVPPVGPTVKEQTAAALTKLVGMAKSALGAGIAEQILEYPLRLSAAQQQPSSAPQQHPQPPQPPATATRSMPRNVVMSDLLDALWARGTAAILTLSAVARSFVLKYCVLVCTHYLSGAATAAAAAGGAVEGRVAADAALARVRGFLLWAVLRLPWHSVDRRCRSAFADWDASIQNVVYDACVAMLRSDILDAPAAANGFSANFARFAILGGGGMHKWVPHSPFSALPAMTNCVCNVFFFATSGLLMGSANAAKWGALLGDMCAALHPFKAAAAAARHAAPQPHHAPNRSPQLVASKPAGACVFDAIFEAIDRSTTAVAAPTTSTTAAGAATASDAQAGRKDTSRYTAAMAGHWFDAMARLWNREVLMRVFGVVDDRAAQALADSSGRAAGGGGASAPADVPPPALPPAPVKESFGDAIRRAFASALADGGGSSTAARPAWVPSRSRDALPEAQLPEAQQHLSWFSYCAFLSLVVSRGKMVSILNQLVQLPFFVPALWRKIGGGASAGRRWIERAMFLVSAERRPAAATAAAAASSTAASTSGAAAALRELDVATDMVCSVSLLFATLSHAMLVGSDDDVRKGWPVGFETLDGIVGFANTTVLLVVALECSPRHSAALFHHHQHGGAAGSALAALHEQLVACKYSLRRFLRLLEDRDVRMALVPEARRGEGFWHLDEDSLKWANSVVEAASPPVQHGRDHDDDHVKDGAPLSGAWVKALSTPPASSSSARAVQALAVDMNLFRTLTGAFALAICREMPHAVPFDLRVAALRHAFLVQKQSRRHGRQFFKVRRENVLEDGFRIFCDAAAAAGPHATAETTEHLRSYMQILLLDEHGRTEAGVDGGGVFKEFLELLLRQITNPEFGLFKLTADGACCYPNPSVESVFDGAHFCGGVQATDMFRFIGRVLGKAVFEGIVVTLPLAGFFLNNVLGRPNVLEDLNTLDPQLFTSLTQLKNMEDASLAGLYLCDEENILGNVRSIPLVPGGEDIEVTNDNVVRYLHLLAHHRLVRSIQRLTDAFVGGLTDVIDRRHVNMFNGKELRQLISGKDGGDFSVDELAASAHYASGYSHSSDQVVWLWQVLRELDMEDRQRFLQFCTGSSRPPLLGFASMQPPFAIQRWVAPDQQQGPAAGARGGSGGGSGSGGAPQPAERSFLDRVFGNDDVQHLPMAATCFNLLKLPQYTSKRNLQERLLVAIRSKAGFEYA